VIPELVKRLEAKLLPVPGTQVRMSKTEFTVGEWKLFLRAEGGSWIQGDVFYHSNKKVKLTDEHPLVLVNWQDARAFCAWLSEKTGREWRLPTNAEWEAAVGNSLYPWGDYYPPHWDDGNYAVTERGTRDPEHIGVDGIFGPAPVASFKPNALGFYDLGGNVGEWMWNGGRLANKDEQMPIRGGSWEWFGGNEKDVQSSHVCFGKTSLFGGIGGMCTGFRLVRKEN
jgi:formylglycine-generating enzyme required for sulfatase activity